MRQLLLSSNPQNNTYNRHLEFDFKRFFFQTVLVRLLSWVVDDWGKGNALSRFKYYQVFLKLSAKANMQNAIGKFPEPTYLTINYPALNDSTSRWFLLEDRELRREL